MVQKPQALQYTHPIINGNKLPNYYNIKDIDYLYS